MSLFNRAEVVDFNFTKRVKEGSLPEPKIDSLNLDHYISNIDLISIFESQIASRHMDLKARLLKDQGKCYYTIGSSGHEGNAVFGEGSQDFYVIRFADVLLMRAEALAETGDIDGAAALVDRVRARVNMPSVADAEGTVNQAQIIEIVRHERRVELALEGLRFIDLKRWGEIEGGIQRASSDPVGPYAPQYLGRRSEVFPIPQTEVDVNKNLVQNPAWQ